MTDDPRRHNQLFPRHSVEAYAAAYANSLREAIAGVDMQALEKVRLALESAAAGGYHVYSIGNGGSAAISDHLCCDLTKGTAAPDHATIRGHSLVANTSLFTAIANDFGYHDVFRRQVEYFCKSGDVLIAVSSSGNSENILSAVKVAKSLGVLTIGMSGFSGGELRKISDISLYVDAKNYGIVEDAHQALIHIMAQFIAAARDI